MADIATPTTLAPVLETEPETRTYTAAAAIALGDVVYLNSAGKVDKARGNATGTANNVVGVALSKTAAGKAVAVLQRGSVAGYAISGMAYGDRAYASTATAGLLQDAIGAGTGNFAVPIGVVLPMNDQSTFTKVLFIDIPFNQVYAALA